MNIKKILFFTLVLFLSVSLLVSAVPQRGKKTGGRSESQTFLAGDFFVTPQVGINSWAVPFGVNLEYAITENIGIGGTVMLMFFSDEGFSATVISPAGEVAYHLTMLNVPNLDLSFGGGVGFSIYTSSGGSGAGGVFGYGLINGRYFFNPKIAASLRLNIGFGAYGSVGGVIGVTFRM